MEEHLLDRTSCLFEIECFDYSDSLFLFVYISVSGWIGSLGLADENYYISNG